MRVTPKISVSPAATMKSEDAPERPVTTCASSEPAERLDKAAARLWRRPELPYRVVGRQEVLAVVVAPVDHHTLAVAHRGAPDERAHRGLVIDRPEHDASERRVELQA